MVFPYLNVLGIFTIQIKLFINLKICENLFSCLYLINILWGNRVRSHIFIVLYWDAEVSSLLFLAHWRNILGLRIILDFTRVVEKEQ